MLSVHLNLVRFISAEYTIVQVYSAGMQINTNKYEQNRAVKQYSESPMTLVTHQGFGDSRPI